MPSTELVPIMIFSDGLNRTKDGGRENLLFEMDWPSSLALRHWCSCSQAFRLALGFTLLAPLSSGLWTPTGTRTYAIGSPGSDLWVWTRTILTFLALCLQVTDGGTSQTP